MSKPDDAFNIMKRLQDFTKVPEIRMPNIAPSPLVTSITENYASEFYDRLMQWISEFENTLDEDHEVGVRLVSFGQTVVFHLTGMNFWNPSLLSFHGVSEEGNPVELIQHVSQISILLMKLPRKDPSKPKRRIGFVTEETEIEK